MSADILGTSWDQCRSTVQYCFTSTETRRLVRTDSPGRPPRLSHSSWTIVCDDDDDDDDDCFYIALFSALEQTHCARMWFYMSDYLFIAPFSISTEVVYLQRWHGWCHMKLLPCRRVLCTPYNRAPCHFTLVYLSVTCHLHFWQNDRGLLRADVLL